MGVRETLNKNPAIAAGATVLLIVAAIFLIYLQLRQPPRPKMSTQQYYSVDDGATFFPDSRELIPPYDKDGKEAVMAHVFVCDKGGDKFVGYLEKFAPEAKKKIDAAASDKNRRSLVMEEFNSQGRLVKRPGNNNKWVSIDNPAYLKIVDPLCPGDKHAIEVAPE